MGCSEADLIGSREVCPALRTVEEAKTVPKKWLARQRAILCEKRCGVQGMTRREDPGRSYNGEEFDQSAKLLRDPGSAFG